MLAAVVDTESDGLLHEATKIHCVVIRCLDTGAVETYATLPGYPSVPEGIERLKQIPLVYGHNLIKHDRPLIKKLHGYEIPLERIRDTFVVASMRFTNLKELDAPRVQKGTLPPDCLGKGSLKAWGFRLGCLKGTFGETADWSICTEEMIEYCRRDVEVNHKLVDYLRAVGVSQQAVETEIELAEYLFHQENNGWPFDINKAVSLQARLVARREQLGDALRQQFGSWDVRLKDFIPKRDNKKLGYVAGVPVAKYKHVTFNPTSRQHISNRLQVLYGWQPTKFTPSGQPQVDDEVLQELPQDIPGIKLLTEYLLVEKRLGQLAEGKQAWLRLAKVHPVTGLPHLHHACLQSGTITHRCAHIRPNIAQVPKADKKVPYGYECRDLFTVPKGWAEVGADMAALEIRELAHYLTPLDGGAYTKAAAEGSNDDGTDIHSLNRDALGLVGASGRDSAKTFFYAWAYGAGDLKLGAQIGYSEAEATSFRKQAAFKKLKARLRDRKQPHDDHTVLCTMKGAALRKSFLGNIPAMGKLIEKVKATAKEKGYLKLHDGRRVPVRHAHAALNTLLQGSGAVACKVWVVRSYRRLKAELGEPGWKGKWSPLAFVHDELQIAARSEVAEQVAKILVEEARAVTQVFNLRCPLDGAAKIGSSWAKTH